mmetsp:Transcript_8980/g.12354  ORF Transcript_8980/g.12354 Transcript_8980/m.12354 type:complete len:321 (-) Transcript_8980:14-976(-)
MITFLPKSSSASRSLSLSSANMISTSEREPKFIDDSLSLLPPSVLLLVGFSVLIPPKIFGEIDRAAVFTSGDARKDTRTLNNALGSLRPSPLTIVAISEPNVFSARSVMERAYISSSLDNFGVTVLRSSFGVMIDGVREKDGKSTPSLFLFLLSNRISEEEGEDDCFCSSFSLKLLVIAARFLPPPPSLAAAESSVGRSTGIGTSSKDGSCGRRGIFGKGRWSETDNVLTAFLTPCRTRISATFTASSTSKFLSPSDFSLRKNLSATSMLTASFGIVSRSTNALPLSLATTPIALLSSTANRSAPSFPSFVPYNTCCSDF